MKSQLPAEPAPPTSSERSAWAEPSTPAGALASTGIDTRAPLTLSPVPGATPRHETASAELAAQQERRRQFVFELAKGLHGDGQQTTETIRDVTALGKRLGLDVTLMPRWGEMIMTTSVPGQSERTLDIAPCTPHHVVMNRVGAFLHLTQVVDASNVELANRSLRLIKQLRPIPLLLFILACIGSALAISLIFGANQADSLLTVAIAATLGALARRGLAHLGVGHLWQIGSAAFLAGLTGVVAKLWHPDIDIHLVALCPALILTPGPPILNGLMDIMANRVTLGVSRLAFAFAILIAISTGLFLGLSVGGLELSLLPPPTVTPIWVDVPAAGLAAASFGTLFSMPRRALLWPVCVGMASHALFWYGKTILGLHPAAAVGMACVCASTVLAPISHRLFLPFSGTGFAAVVSMIPGAYIFRMTSGLMQLQNATGEMVEPLLVATLSHAVTAVQMVMAMSLGLVVPKQIYDEWRSWRERRQAAAGKAP